jgi:hypothetical protein
VAVYWAKSWSNATLSTPLSASTTVMRACGTSAGYFAARSSINKSCTVVMARSGVTVTQLLSSRYDTKMYRGTARGKMWAAFPCCCSIQNAPESAAHILPRAALRIGQWFMVTAGLRIEQDNGITACSFFKGHEMPNALFFQERQLLFKMQAKKTWILLRATHVQRTARPLSARRPPQRSGACGSALRA